MKIFSIRTRLLLTFLLTSIVTLTVSLYTNWNINRATSQIGAVYKTNANLNELRDVLENVHKKMTGYLETKSSKDLEDYYRYEGEYTKMLERLSGDIAESKNKIMEKNIRNISFYYLSLTDKVIQSKRGRNVASYKERYEEADRLYHYIKHYIYGLNNQQFQNNSAHYTVLMESLTSMEVLSIAIYIIVTVCNIGFIFFTTNRITNPLKALTKAADEVASGNLEIPFLKAETKDELGVVSAAFNKMVVNLKEYIEKIKESMAFESRAKEKELLMENHLKDAQLKYLQAQINPHFLFNTLNAGLQLSMMEDAERTYTFLEKTSEFFRYNIRKITADTSLLEEIKLVENYLYIMNVRFGGEILYKKEILCNIEDIRVPSMILQPIIENAITYGISDIEWQGEILLKILKKEQFLFVSIADNGMGMTKERLLEVRQGKEKKEKELLPSSNGIGLVNVRKRLGLYFKERAVFEIDSKGVGKGTIVTMKIPMAESK